MTRSRADLCTAPIPAICRWPCRLPRAAAHSSSSSEETKSPNSPTSNRSMSRRCRRRPPSRRSSGASPRSACCSTCSTGSLSARCSPSTPLMSCAASPRHVVKRGKIPLLTEDRRANCKRTSTPRPSLACATGPLRRYDLRAKASTAARANKQGGTIRWAMPLMGTESLERHPNTEAWKRSGRNLRA